MFFIMIEFVVNSTQQTSNPENNGKLWNSLRIRYLSLLVLYRYLTATFDYWKKRGPKPILLFGIMKDAILKKVFMGKYIKDLYDAYENTPFIGMFNMREPVLMRKEPKILKDVLIKDSSIFYNRQMDSCTKVCISFHGDNHYVIFLFDLKIWWLNLYPRTHRREPLRHFLFFNTGLTAQHLKTKILSSFIEIDTNSLARERTKRIHF